MKCPRCFADTPKGSNFCANCGHSLPPGLVQPAIQDSPNPSKYIGVGLVGAILLIGIIGLGAAGLLRFTPSPSKPVLPV
ncbi:MAG: hypothetical protein ABL962_20020, partial [Fimbriimonadaceae bacterium]